VTALKEAATYWPWEENEGIDQYNCHLELAVVFPCDPKARGGQLFSK
jgi:hypothetical protein